ncbi:MAG: MFS transporter, partial [Pseudomonadales bacterium]|nr:MFS transporter [Pseudomonadales bacterium]
MIKTSKILLTSSLIAALGGLLFGFDTAVISGTTDALVEQFNLTPSMKGFTVAIALIGTIIGAVTAGKPSDKFGRRATMFWLAIFFFVSAVGCAFAWDWYSLLIFRFIGGPGIGGASVGAPMYIAEIAPAKQRGRLVALAQFNIVLGILVAYLSNYIIALFSFGAIEWRVMLGIEAVPAAVYFFLLYFVPRSPRWLMACNREEEARKVLTLVGTDEGRTVDQEIDEISKSLDRDKDSLKEAFFQPKYLKPIMLVIAIAMFNQLSGINAILYYSKDIFE